MQNGHSGAADWTYTPPLNANLAADMPYWMGGLKGVPLGATVKLPGGTTVTRDPSDEGVQIWRVPGVSQPWRRLPDAPDAAFFVDTGINAQPKHGSSTPGAADKIKFNLAYNTSLWWFRNRKRAYGVRHSGAVFAKYRKRLRTEPGADGSCDSQSVGEKRNS